MKQRSTACIEMQFV